MPQQLIYTSAPRGVVAGRSGYCTVARSALMREALTLKLEQLSYYQHLSLSGARERPIFAYRIIDIRGTRFHVLSRIQDAGLDFTGRTNFTAHHIALKPEEIRQITSPAVILRDWSGWVGVWTMEPKLLSDENWGNLSSLAEVLSVPAQTWKRLTGDAVSGYGLLEAKTGITFTADGAGERESLSLLAESVALLEVRDHRRDYKTAAWQYTFTTSLQEQDNPADFRWRFLHSDNPAFVKLAGAECRALASVRPSGCTEEEASLARLGRQKPRFLEEPQDARAVEGQPVTFQAKAEGVPYPDYEWYEVDRAGNAKGLLAQGTQLTMPAVALGISRYVVRASNAAGEVISRVALLGVEPKVRLQRDRTSMPVPASTSRRGHVRSAEEIENQRSRIEVQKAEQVFRRRQKRKVTLGLALAAAAMVAIASAFVVFRSHPRLPPVSGGNTSVGPSNNGTAGSMAEVSGVGNTNAQPPTNTSGTQKAPSVPANQGASGAVEGRMEAHPPGFGREDFPHPPPPWESKVVGQAVVRTNAVAMDSQFVLTGAGKGIGERGNNFFFLRQPASNSVRFSARLLRMEQGPPQSLCGIMIRESDDADAPFAFIGASPFMIFSIQRDGKGEPCRATQTYGWKGKPISFPISFRISCDTNSLIPEYSMDGTNWTILEPPKPSPSARYTNYLVGFAVCSGHVNASVTAYFDNISSNSLARTIP
jgi:GTPase-associated protein 1, N-terminal domain type 2